MAKNALIVLLIVILGYNVWALFGSARYVSLCDVSYWSATPKEMQSCNEMKSELDTQ
ncbi:MAG: hypothetical protein HYS06_08455 [Methylocystis sp.]|nr:hypothetical protein [Methylocystis sp.]